MENKYIPKFQDATATLPYAGPFPKWHAAYKQRQQEKIAAQKAIADARAKALTASESNGDLKLVGKNNEYKYEIAPTQFQGKDIDYGAIRKEYLIRDLNDRQERRQKAIDDYNKTHENGFKKSLRKVRKFDEAIEDTRATQGLTFTQTGTNSYQINDPSLGYSQFQPLQGVKELLGGKKKFQNNLLSKSTRYNYNQAELEEVDPKKMPANSLPDYTLANGEKFYLTNTDGVAGIMIGKADGNNITPINVNKIQTIGGTGIAGNFLQGRGNRVALWNTIKNPLVVPGTEAVATDTTDNTITLPTTNFTDVSELSEILKISDTQLGTAFPAHYNKNNKSLLFDGITDAAILTELDLPSDKKVILNLADNTITTKSEDGTLSTPVALSDEQIKKLYMKLYPNDIIAKRKGGLLKLAKGGYITKHQKATLLPYSTPKVYNSAPGKTSTNSNFNSTNYNASLTNLGLAGLSEVLTNWSAVKAPNRPLPVRPRQFITPVKGISPSTKLTMDSTIGQVLAHSREAGKRSRDFNERSAYFLNAQKALTGLNLQKAAMNEQAITQSSAQRDADIKGENQIAANYSNAVRDTVYANDAMKAQALAAKRAASANTWMRLGSTEANRYFGSSNNDLADLQAQFETLKNTANRTPEQTAQMQQIYNMILMQKSMQGQQGMFLGKKGGSLSFAEKAGIEEIKNNGKAQVATMNNSSKKEVTILDNLLKVSQGAKKDLAKMQYETFAQDRKNIQRRLDAIFKYAQSLKYSKINANS